MSTLLQIVAHPRIVANALDLTALTITVAGIPVDLRALEALRVAGGTGGLEIDLSEAGQLELRVTGFANAGTTYTITATSRLENLANVAWRTEGADAVSPQLTAEGTYTLVITATPKVGTTRMLSTVSVKISKPGKPDDFLNNFAPT